MKDAGHFSREDDGYRLVFHRTLNHPIEAVWDAITNPEQLKYWFTDIEIDPVPGGKVAIRLRGRERSVSTGEILEIRPPRKFVWTWEGELAVWELEAAGETVTWLTLTYGRLPADGAVGAAAGFHELLDRLEDRLGGSETVYPFGTEEHTPGHIRLKVHYAAAVYNTCPEVVRHKPVTVEKTYGAPVDRVWQALTDKDQMRKWYFDLGEFRPEAGFQFKFYGHGHKGEQYLHLCTVTEAIPGKKLQYSWEYEGLPGYSLVTFELFPAGGGTRLRLSHHGLETFPQDSADFAWGSFNEGWGHILGIGLPGFLEETPASGD